jgi:branched-chain amino acid transport system substrate-binding protein
VSDSAAYPLARHARKFEGPRIPVPMAAAQAYDATYLLAHAVLSLPADRLDGPGIKARKQAAGGL